MILSQTARIASGVPASGPNAETITGNPSMTPLPNVAAMPNTGRSAGGRPSSTRAANADNAQTRATLTR